MRALEGALAEEVVHKGADVQADLRPERLVVGLKDHPLGAAVEALLDVERQAADGDVLLLGGQLIGAAVACARPRPRVPTTGKLRRQLMPSGLSSPFSSSVRLTSRPLDAV